MPLGGGDGSGIPAESIEVCRDFCEDTDGCEAIVFGEGKCWGKKDVRTSKCQRGGGYVTEVLSHMPFGTCSLLGDPHVLTFDDPNGDSGAPLLTQFAAGDFYLVKADNFVIQGRFGFSERFPTASSLVGLAIGGDLIGRHTLVVEYVGPTKGREGFAIWLDNTKILTQGYPVSFKSKDNLIRAFFGNLDPDSFGRQARHTIGGLSGHLPSMFFNIAPDIQIYLLLGEDTMNAVITLRKFEHAIDGYCGNFNCIPEDDAVEVLKARGVAQQFPRRESLFKTAALTPAVRHEQNKIAVTGAVLDLLTPSHGGDGAEGDLGGAPLLQDCGDVLMKKADQLCRNLDGGFKAACIFDYCASGGSRDMGNEDVEAGALVADVEDTTQMFGWAVSWMPAVLRVKEAPSWLQAFIGLGAAAGLVVGFSIGLGRRGQRKESEVRSIGPRSRQDFDEEQADDDSRVDVDSRSPEDIPSERMPLLLL